MKTISFAFNDFDFVIDPFQFAGIDWIITMVQNTVAIAFNHLSEAVQGAMIQ